MKYLSKSERFPVYNILLNTVSFFVTSFHFLHFIQNKCICNNNNSGGGCGDNEKKLLVLICWYVKIYVRLSVNFEE